MKVKIISILLFLFSFNVAYSQDLMRVLKIISVYDGDTFKVDLDCEIDVFCNKISIRVSGIDAPEIRGICQKEKELAIKARDFAREFLSQDEVTLKNMDRGKYFRIVADAFVNGNSLAQQLIKKGLAIPYDGGKKQHDWCND